MAGKNCIRRYKQLLKHSRIAHADVEGATRARRHLGKIDFSSGRRTGRTHMVACAVMGASLAARALAGPLGQKKRLPLRRAYKGKPRGRARYQHACLPYETQVMVRDIFKDVPGVVFLDKDEQHGC